MTRLHGCDYFELFEALDLLRIRDLRVFDTKAIISAAIGRFYFRFFRCLLRFCESIERHLRASVANGMETDLISSEHALFGHRIQLRRFILRKTAVLRILAVRFEQCGSLGAERAIHKTLQHSGM